MTPCTQLISLTREKHYWEEAARDCAHSSADLIYLFSSKYFPHTKLLIICSMEHGRCVLLLFLSFTAPSLAELKLERVSVTWLVFLLVCSTAVFHHQTFSFNTVSVHMYVNVFLLHNISKRTIFRISNPYNPDIRNFFFFGSTAKAH